RGLALNGQWLLLGAPWHWPQTINSAARISGKTLAFWRSLYVLAKSSSLTPSTASSTLAWPSASTPPPSTKSCTRSLLRDRPVQQQRCQYPAVAWRATARRSATISFCNTASAKSRAHHTAFWHSTRRFSTRVARCLHRRHETAGPWQGDSRQR